MSRFEFPIRVRYAETDQMGVVYHANYLVWFEIGRVELMRSLGLDYRTMEKQDGCRIAVVEAVCRYHAPAHYDDELIVGCRVTVLRRSLLKFGYEVLRREPDGERRLLAEGHTTHVAVTPAMKRTSLPERYAALLRKVLDQQG